MNDESTYYNYLKSHGRSLEEINPGSNEFALSIGDSLNAIEILRAASISIKGGDVLTEREGKLAYVYQILGDKYHYLNWYCEKKEAESEMGYVMSSYLKSREAIEHANMVTQTNGIKCFIVIVV